MGENEDVHRRDPASLGDETTIYLETDGNAVKSLYAIVEVSNGGASIVDTAIVRLTKRGVRGQALAPKTVSPDAECDRSELHYSRSNSSASGKPSSRHR